MAEHFTQPPHWDWWITFYFYIAGLAGGSYVLATILRARGSARDEATARIGYMLAFPLVVICAILLTIDLGQPLRFYHMLVNVTPGAGGLNFKPWSPISLGSWGLLIFGLFAFISFLESRGMFRALPMLFTAIGSLFGLFLCAYTGVVLSVSNQPVWSDSWAIGALFVASALSASAALLAWFARSDDTDGSTGTRLMTADRSFVFLELIALAIFFVTLAMAGTLGKTLSGIWLVLWVLVIASMVPPLMGRHRGLVAIGVLAGVLLMRIAVIFSAQS
jgi:formate-dependent nitrite reductase membrane component NrfD